MNPRRSARARSTEQNPSEMYQQTSFLDQPGAVRRDHPETSRESARKIASKTSELRERILANLRVTGPATDEQIQERLSLDPSTERPRRVELVKQGLVVDSGKTRLTRSRRPATVWTVA